MVASELPGVWGTVHICMTDYMRAHLKEFISKRQSQKKQTCQRKTPGP